jgi:hypothetical protein
MCGIVYAKDLRSGTRRKGVNYKVIAQYTKQRARGTQGFGFYAPESDRFVHHTEEKRILSLLRREKGAKEILFHHRNPTSTANTFNSAHPISTRSQLGKALDHIYIGVHNGMLTNSNAQQLKLAHEKRGIVYSSIQSDGRFNDSESLIWELALYLDGKKSTMDAIGGMAWIVMRMDKNGQQDKLFFGRNTNPLNIHRKQHRYLTLSSTGAGEPIAIDTLYTFDYETQEYIKKPLHMSTWANSHTSAAGQSNLGFHVHATGDETTHDFEFTGSKSFSLIMAGHVYTNGRWDNAGYWHERELIPATSSTSILTREEKTALYDLLPKGAIENYMKELIKLANGDRVRIDRIILYRREKLETEYIVAKEYFEQHASILLDDEEFENADAVIQAKMLDCYIVELVYQRLVHMTDGKFAEIKEEAKNATPNR